MATTIQCENTKAIDEHSEAIAALGAALAAEAAEVASLKRDKADKTEVSSRVSGFAPVGGAPAAVENGVADLSAMFTGENATLVETIESHGGSGSVASVNGKTGVVQLTAADVGALPSDGKAVGVGTDAKWIDGNGDVWESGVASYVVTPHLDCEIYYSEPLPEYSEPERWQVYVGGDLVVDSWSYDDEVPVPDDSDRDGGWVEFTYDGVVYRAEKTSVHKVDRLALGSELGSRAPGKIILTLVSVTTPTQHYEIRRDDVAQTFEQVRGYVAAGEVFINHANVFYKPTYSGSDEIMFGCVGIIGGKVETRRIQMLASGAVALSDLKVLVEDSMLPYPIAATTGALADRTVNTGTATTFTIPAALTGGKARDFVLVLDLTSGEASTITINPPTGETVQLLVDADDTFSAEAGKVNILYFSEITVHKFMVVRKAVA